MTHDITEVIEYLKIKNETFTGTMKALTNYTHWKFFPTPIKGLNQLTITSFNNTPVDFMFKDDEITLFLRNKKIKKLKDKIIQLK